MSMFIRATRSAALWLLVCSSLTACGGSDSESGSTASQQQDNAPILQANAAPTIEGEPAINVQAGDYYLFMPLAGDADGDPLVFTVENLPDWAAFDPATGAITGIPSDMDTGVTPGVVITVSDGSASTRLAGFAITVNEATPQLASIVISWLPPTENEDGSSLTDLAAYRIYYGTVADNLDRSVRIDNPGLATYVIENLTPGTWYIGTTAINKSGLESDMSNIAEVPVS